MKAIVDKEACSGCGLCADNVPDVFEMQGDVAVVKADPVPGGQEDKVKEAAADCPVEAIKVE